jgi:hypothetical protein
MHIMAQMKGLNSEAPPFIFNKVKCKTFSETFTFHFHVRHVAVGISRVTEA